MTNENSSGRRGWVIAAVSVGLVALVAGKLMGPAELADHVLETWYGQVASGAVMIGLVALTLWLFDRAYRR
ncbi:hypothetical protein [Actinoplanes sp. GCM10030250]|uniref:hypothetical protein n=1 Tax=Actinoplanes sp. GCM10030250 TaxID=3273376 RepID=UPI0036159B71